jgi:hypothetical protein
MGSNREGGGLLEAVLELMLTTTQQQACEWNKWVPQHREGLAPPMRGRGNTTMAGGNEWEGHHHDDFLPLTTLFAVRQWVFSFCSIV